MSNIPLSKTRRRFYLRSLWITLLALVFLALFLSPLLYMLFTALKTPQQMSMQGAPLWPASQATFTHQGKSYDLYQVPTDQGVRELALYQKGRDESQFLDPADPGAPPITWKGSYRTLSRTWHFAPAWSNFVEVWKSIQFPRLLFNTLALAILTEIGTLTSCILVAYGFSRFRFPGKGLLFTLLISTIFLPAAVTLVPTYTFFVKIGWVGTWLPLIVPTFFANAYDVFLLRQYFLTIPHEIDEAAMIDGAGPFRTLISILLPQALPVIVAVSIFHIVWSWNDFFGPMIYLSTRPELQPIAVGINRFNGIHSTRPPLVQAASLMAMLIPMIIFLIGQRAFMRGVVITGVEK